MCPRLEEYFLQTREKRKNFAERIGCSVTMLFYIMKGKRNPSTKMQRKIVEGTDYFVQYSDFFYEAK